MALYICLTVLITLFCFKATLQGTPNGINCYSCGNGTDTNCSKIKACEDDDKQCYSAKVPLTDITFKGCISSCDVFPQSGYYVCCSKDLCNDAQSLTQSLMLLLAPLLYILLI